MRVLLAPDKFAGTLTAPEAAAAMAAGWRRTWPGDTCVEVPMADGGPGFLDALAGSVGGRINPVRVTGPLGDPVEVGLLVVPAGDTGAATAAATGGNPGSNDPAGPVVYLESAQACGLHLMVANGPDGVARPVAGAVERGTTVGVGEALLAALAHRPSRIVIGLGGSGTNDGGAGMLAALGAVVDGDAAGVTLRSGLAGLPGFTSATAAVDPDADAGAVAPVGSIDLAPARARFAGVQLVAATDVVSPLAGPSGASRGFGAQKGLRSTRMAAADRALLTYAGRVAPRLVARPGAGAAGGLGFALLALGASAVPGGRVVADAVGLRDRIGVTDLVITGEGRLDPLSLGGKTVSRVAELAREVGVPCIALAGVVDVGPRELAAAGIDGAYGLVPLVGRERAFAAPAASLEELTARAARMWGRS